MNTTDGQERLEKLEEQVAQLRKDIGSLVTAWEAATGLVKFIKFLATLIAAVGAIFMFVKNGFHS